MSTRVYGWDQNPAVDRFVYRCSNTSAARALVDGIAERIVDGDGRRAIKLREPEPESRAPQPAIVTGVGYVSAKTILLFIRTHCAGDRLHYEIPHAGDRSAAVRAHRSRISVSGRSIFNYAYQCARSA